MRSTYLLMDACMIGAGLSLLIIGTYATRDKVPEPDFIFLLFPISGILMGFGVCWLASMLCS